MGTEEVVRPSLEEDFSIPQKVNLTCKIAICSYSKSGERNQTLKKLKRERGKNPGSEYRKNIMLRVLTDSKFLDPSPWAP